MDATAPQRGPLAALGWACFVGSSWTWIIGMVFPVLLLRDYGVAGWWVFAVPNVIGAAAMGFVLARPEVSARVFDEHTGMCVRFSEATLAFHFFVATWLFTRLLGGWWPVPAVIALGLGFWYVSVRDRGAVLASVAVSLVSLVLFGVLLGADGAWLGVGGEALPHAESAAGLSGSHLWFFALASGTGFLLCPYLDATFHRARQATAAGTGKAAFAIGFGGVFLTMIVFTLAYAGRLIPWLDEDAERVLPPMWTWILGTHLLLQSGLTIGLHLREANEVPTGYRLSPRLLVVAVVGVGLGLLLSDAPLRLTEGRTLLDGEVIYRSFLLLYGLVFPAYVFLVMLPPMRGTVARPVRVGLFLVAAVASLPLGFAGFVMGIGWAIAAAVGLLVVARAILEAVATKHATKASR